MNVTIRRFLSLIVFFSVLAAPLLAAPQAPVELRVSDTPGWSGAYDEPVGLSPHLHFRVRHLTTGAASPAVKLKVQLSTDSGFSEVLWDSGFVAIASTANLSLTPAIPYTGPALLPGATYMWRAAVQDDQNIPSAYSEVAAFEVAASGTCADLRVTTGVGSEEIQGNPVSVTVWPPSLSAEYVAGDQVSYAFVEVSRTSDFFTTLWSSGPVPTGALSAAQRTPAVSYAGPMLEPGDPYFWRIRVAQTVEGESAWSSAASSFVFLPPDPAMPAPGGFSRTSSSFGSAGYETSDLVACNWDGNNSPDIVEVTRSEPGTLTLYRNIGTSSPSPALPFGESRGGTTLAAVSDFDWNGAADIAVLDQYGLRVYVPDGAGGIELGNELSIPGFGEPVALQVTDTRWDGWLDIIVAYESCVLQIVNAEGVFESIEIMEGFENPVTDLLVTDFEPDDGLQEMWIISGGMLYLCREFGWLQQEWSLGDITRIALADGANPILPELIMAGPQELIHCTVVGDGTGAVELITNVIFSHGQQSDCIDLKGSNLDGVDAPEVVLVTAEGVTIWLRAGANYELYEYVGHPGGAGNLSVALADMNVDNFPDVVVGKSDTPHTIHFNAPRIGASIANSQATQVQFGEAFVEFQVTLDAPPVSMVEVLCETYEEESGGGGGGDGDALPDPRDFLNTQVGPLWYTPSAIWLKFTPGQLSSTFRVPLTSYYQASQWTLHVRIVKVIGGYIGQQTATASVYAMPPTSGSSGQTSGAGVSRDWQIEGEVHDIVHAGNNTYFGGDFSGITWDAQGVAALNLTGERKVKLPNLSGSVRTVAVHPDGSIYFGGLFTIDVGQSLQIKNIAKCDASGNLVTGFAPNPNDAVNAIAFDSYDRVYFGGKFTELLQTPGRVHNRLAWVYCNGQIDTTYNGSNRFGVANSYTPANAEVLVLKVAKSGFASNTEYLLVGGEKFNYALRGVSPYTYSLMLGFSYAFGNFTGFEISGSRVLTGPAFSGPVNAIEVDTSRTIGYQASHPIVIGGAYSVGKYSPTIYTSSFLTVTNFNGEYWAQQGSLTPVHALKFDEHGHLWVGRRATYSMGGTVLTEDPLSVFAWAAQGQQWSYLQQPAGPFNISSGWVESFACGTDEILAVGNFEVVENGQNVAENLAVFSTEAASLGARLNHITTTTNAWGPLRSAAACFNSGGHAGYAIVGPFSKLVIERDNLAAMDAAGHILPWAPRANAPVKAMATDGTKIYFGGAFNLVSGSPRQGVAVALANSDATSALNWTADVSGAQATVEALTLTGSHLVIGGDFMSINGVPYNDVAAVLTSGSGAAIVANWDVNLMDGSADQVYSLCLDGTRLFIGGSFLGISGQPSRPGLLAVSLPEAGTPQINPFDANVSWPCAVKDVSVTPDHVIFVGNFSTVGGQPRNGIACCTRAMATLTSLNPTPNGPIHCVTSTSSGLVYVGGEFSTLTNDQGSGPVVLPRKGIAVLDTAGIVQSWTANVLTVGNLEAVHVLKLEYGSQTKVWAGGCFTGAVVAGQDHLTWFGSSLSITTASLPAVNSGQPFPLTQIQLSEQVSCTWSTSGPADAWLDIDAQGVLSGTAPVIPHGSPLIVPLLIEANFGASGTASRWFQVTILPPPPPTVVSVTGVTSVTEGNTVVKSPTPTWSVNLNQPFSTPVHVMIQYVDAGARNGYEYSPQVNQVIFYPSGLPVPTNLPAGTIATNTLSVQLPVTLYGDKVFDGVPRKFIIQLISQTLNVSPDPFNSLLTVEVLDDDPASPVPEPAYVLFAQVREDATTPANPQGVVTDQPFIGWEFGSDISTETQGWWQVEVSKDPAFISFADGYAGPQTAGADEFFQLPVQLLDNTQYYARVRVWPTSGGAGGSPSEWFNFAFRLNAPPLQAYGLSPAGTIFTARPKLTWYISDDPEGAPQHVVVHLTEVGGSGQSHLLDSRVSPYLFEYQSGGNWSQVSQLGIPAGVTVVRLQVPAGMALTPTPVTWDWSVDVSDPFETAVGTTINTIEVDPHYVIEGVYVDANGTPLPARQLNAVLLPSHTPLNSVPETTGPDGRFRFTLTNSLAPGEAIGVFVDPNALDPTTLNPFNEYAGAVIRFPGSDLVETSGTFAQLTLVLGACHLDAREQGNFNLGDLAPPTAPVTPVPGYAFTLTSNVLEMTGSVERLELRAELRVRGNYAIVGEPTVLSLTASQHTLTTTTEGSLSIEDGAAVNVFSFANAGSMVIHPNGLLTLGAHSETTGMFSLLQGGTLAMNTASLTINGGDAQFQAGVVTGVTGVEALKHAGGTLLISRTEFANCALEVGPSAANTTVNSAVFTPGDNPYCIHWTRVTGQPATMKGIRFEAAPVGTPDNVRTVLGADQLTMKGSGGDLAGEAYDNDPGEIESPPYDIVAWEVAPVTGLTAYPGDEKILLVWDAGAQTGAAFMYEIHEAATETGPFILADTTTNNFYIRSQLTNNFSYYYFVRTVAGSQHQDSDVESATPQDATIASSSPVTVGSNGFTPGLVIGSHTHFSSTTDVTCATAGVTIPSSSFMVLSPSLLLFDVETIGVAEGTTIIEVDTPEVWANLGVPGYSELLQFDLEIITPTTLDYPGVRFVDAGGAVSPEDVTSGQFNFAVEFTTFGGAAIDPSALECYLDRDIEVNGELVEAWTDVAYLWDNVDENGGTWLIEQVSASESIEPGMLTCVVSVANEYGYRSQQAAIRIYIEGGNANFARASGAIYHGEDNQQIDIVCNTIGQSDSVWFLNDRTPADGDVSTDISVQNVSVNGSTIHVTVDVETLAQLGIFTFLVGEQSNPPQKDAQGVWQNVNSLGVYEVKWKHFDYSVYTQGGSGGGSIANGTVGAGSVGPNAIQDAAGVVLQNGEFRNSTVDMAVKGPVMDIVWDRHYRSSRAGELTPLGRGWFNTYTQTVTVSSGATEFVWSTATGELIKFCQNGLETKGRYLASAVYKPQPGVAAKAWLVKKPNWNDLDWYDLVIQAADGRFYVFTNWNAPLGTYELRYIEDSYGNKILVDNKGAGRPSNIAIIYNDNANSFNITVQVRYGDGSGTVQGKGLVAAIASHTSHVEHEPYRYYATPLQHVSYKYSSEGYLTAYSTPDGYSFSDGPIEGQKDHAEDFKASRGILDSELSNRHGQLFGGYFYNVESQSPTGPYDHPRMLKGVYPPSKTVLVAQGTDGWIVDETASGHPELSIKYDRNNGLRVEEHTWEGGSERKVAIQYGTTSQPSYGRVVTWHDQRAGASPATLSTEYVLNDDGQATSATQDGQTTVFDYYAGNEPTKGAQQGLKKVTYPRGNAVEYIYEKAQADVMASFQPTEIIRRPVSGTEELKTTYVVEEETLQDRSHYTVTKITDPWGNVTEVKHNYTEGQVLPSTSVLHSVVTTKTFTSAEGIFERSSRTAITTTFYDGYGRITRIEESNDGLAETSKLKYEYYDEVKKSYRGFLKSAQILKDNETTSNVITEHKYNDLGFVEEVIPPHGASGYPLGDQSTKYHTNKAGQVLHVEHPVAGGVSSGGQRAHTWYYYDKDGQVVREINSFASVGTGGATTSATGMEADSAIDGAFAQPTSLSSAGWVHTQFEYNPYGELVQTKQDLDLNRQAVVVETNGYDGFGRLVETSDAEGRIVHTTYDDRNLVTRVTAAPNTTDQTVYEYAYDQNGNVIQEGYQGSEQTRYFYDGYDRPFATYSKTSDGWLHHARGYPAPRTSGGWTTVTDMWVYEKGLPGSNSVPELTKSNSKRWTETSMDELGQPIQTMDLAISSGGVPLGVQHGAYAGYPGSSSSTETELPNIRYEVAQVDSRGRQHKMFVNGGQTAGINLYNALGWMLFTRLDDSQALTTYSYQPTGQPKAEWTPRVVGETVSAKYTEQLYDPSGNSVKMIENQSGASIETMYYRNDRGWVEKVEDGEGRYTKTEYNFVGWPRKTVRGKGVAEIITETTYDKSGLVVEETATRGTEPQSTTYQYDNQGRLKTVIRPGIGETDYDYDSQGRLNYELRKKENIWVQYFYDTAGQLSERKAFSLWGGATGSVSSFPLLGLSALEREEFTYNEFGEILTAESFDQSGKTARLAMKYNSLGMIDEQMLTVYEGGLPVNVKVNQPHLYTEQELGFKSLYQIGEVDDDPKNEWAIRATYDARGRELSTAFWDGRQVVTAYSGNYAHTVCDKVPKFNGSRTVLTYSYTQGVFSKRTFGNNSAFTYTESCRGLLHEVKHTRGWWYVKTFAGVDVRYDYSGNPVYESRKHQGGLVRAMKYDHVGRLVDSYRGHLDPVPANDLQGGHDPQQFQHRREYGQDEVDNVTHFRDYLWDAVQAKATEKATITQAIKPGSGNLIDSRTGYADKFKYDNGNRIQYDPTTGLSYEYNYRGQVTKIKNGPSTVRKMSYDAFGRMVHQVDAPGASEERGTIFIPNIGFGGDGHGADTAGQVTYGPDKQTNPDGSVIHYTAEVLQYTYGLGAVANGIGRKRVLEFVTYGGSDFKPYYRYLHEDAMGNTVATTDQWGDRRDEYDYTDYGVPIHAPIIYDGRSVASIAPHGSHADVSVVTLSAYAPVPETASLVGREFRVVKKTPSSPEDVYLAGTVIANMGSVIHIHDPGNAIATTWLPDPQAPWQTNLDRELTAVFDLHEGFVKGVVDSKSTGTWNLNGWNEACVYLRVDLAPFQSWMFSQAGSSELLKVTLDGPSNQTTTATVMGVAEASPDNQAFHKLVVQAKDLPAWVDAGCKYYIDGRRYKVNVAQTGTWPAAASGGSFTVDSKAALTPWMVGWILQPNINQQVYLPVTSVDPNTGTLTVADGYASLADVGPPGNFKGARWRLFAPPGTITGRRVSGSHTDGAHAGTLSKWVGADSSRCLYAGYQYESPLAGFWSTQTSTVKHRQQGLNLAGQHYTLHRHYDPTLMRFTSPDPIASPWWNLHGYAGNSPAGCYDPDGLSEESEYWGNWLRRQGQDSIDEMRANGEHTRAGVNEGIRNTFAGVADILFGVIYGGYDFTNWLKKGEEMSLTKTSNGLSKKWEARQETIRKSGASTWAQVSAFVVLSFGDLIGATQIFVEGGAGVNSVTGQKMTAEERAAAATEGGLSLFLWSRTARARGLKGGNPGESTLAKKFQGQKTTFRDVDIVLRRERSVSRVREIDNLTSRGVAHESKVGYVEWSKAKYQILKDSALIRSGDIQSAHWHFFRSNKTGRIGADPRVLRLLKHKGIKYTVYGRARQPSSPPAGVLPDFGDD